MELLPKGSYDSFSREMGINFDWLGATTTKVAIGTNGMLQLGDLPEQTLEPFRADADTRGANNGHIWIKNLTNGRFVVLWEEVYSYGSIDHTGIHNTFQAVLSDVNSDFPQVCFCYDEMMWNYYTNYVAVARRSSGAHFEIGAFDRTGDTWNGLGSHHNGVGTLDGRSFCFDIDAVLGVNPPSNEQQLSYFNRTESPPLPDDGPKTEPINFHGDGCVDYNPSDSGWELLPKNDDKRFVKQMGIDFDWLGNTTNRIEIGTNGYLYMDEAGLKSLEPYEADSDTRGAHNGNIWIKNLTDGRYAVVWEDVYYYGSEDHTGIHNTFQAVLADVNSDYPQVCYCYDQMQWNRFTDYVGVGLRTWSPSKFTIATFNQTGSIWNGIGSSHNGVGALNGRSFCFDISSVLGTHPPTTVEQLTYTRRTETNPRTPGSGGDPHFKTWNNEHFQYHGQCDLVLTKDDHFADDLGLDIHIRTKLVRYWSYIKTAAIRIGNDILEIEGSSSEPNYWINYEHQGELNKLGSFPVTFKSDGTKHQKTRYDIDLSSKYPGQKITISTYKEFVKVDFTNPDEAAFGNTVGMLGDFETGMTLARDGSTELYDFTELGHEWQVLPSDKKLFREASEPQFPAKCIDPEDPRGDRRRGRHRRLDESMITEEEAEAACSFLEDELDRKDCVYDIVATQDLDMAGAY